LFRRRVHILLGAMLLVGAGLILRLAQVQIGWHERFSRDDYARAGGSHLVETVRGGIYTRWGTPLALEVPSFGLGVYYGALADGGWKRPLAELCGIPVAELTEEAERIIRNVERIEDYVCRRQGRDDIRVAERYQYHCLVEDVPAEVAALVRAEPGRLPRFEDRGRSIPVVKVLEGTRRRYPNGELAPHVVGDLPRLSPEMWESLAERGCTWTMGEPFSQIGRRYKMDDRIGASGVEKACEKLLRGARGYVLNRLVFGVLSVQKESSATPPEPGHDVYLALREDFQRAANSALERAAQDEALGFKSGSLIIVDVRDGSVLAAATYPGYDLATFRDEFDRLSAEPRRPFLFRPLQAALPTGSVYKVITAIAALEEGAITPSTTRTCEGREVFRAGRSAKTFHCTGRHGTIPLLTAIEKSCNIYFYHTGLAAGGEALARWGRGFGLGRPTGVDLPYENAGQLPTPRHTYGILNLSIGQGDLLCTPLQVACAMAAIANGGRLYRPHFLHHARGAGGEVVREFEPEFARVPVSVATLSVVREGMRLAVESGTARRAGLDVFGAAGKTGTAELGSGQPNHAWFAGYAPFDDPRIAFAVVNERVPGGHGGSHAAPIVAFALEDIWSAIERMP
jgi:penicillin-binding protein 2